MKLSFEIIFVLFVFINDPISVKGQYEWNQKTNFCGAPRDGAICFSIGDKGYVGGGVDGGHFYKNFWEYDPATNVWTQKANLPSGPRAFAFSFSINSIGYLGTGRDTSYAATQDFWSYDPFTDTWEQKADFPGGVRYSTSGFALNGKGYAGCGFDNSEHYSDFWQYDPTTDSWNQKSDFPGDIGSHYVGFSIDSLGYMGIGAYSTGFWQYDPETDIWKQKNDFPGSARSGSVGFEMQGRGYVGTGHDGLSMPGYVSRDFWEYDPQTDLWLEKETFGGSGRYLAIGFAIEGRGYIGTGNDTNGINLNDFWEYAHDSIIDLFNNNNLVLYPNPNSGLFYINLFPCIGLNENTLCVIYNLHGDNIASQQLNAYVNFIDLKNNGIADGTYFYKIIGNNEIIQQGKMIIVN